MKNLIIGLLVMSGLASFAHSAGNPEAGEPLTIVCSACHGADGNSAVGNFPKLAGQGERYLLKQLHDVKEGRRIIVEMTGILAPYSDQQLEDMAAYYAAQTSTIGEADPELVALGEQLYKMGNAETGVPSCMGCHSANGSGNSVGGFPMLSGQHAQYTASQLVKFKNGYLADGPSADARVNGGDAAIMRNIAFRLKDHEIEALASYIQGLH